MHYKLNAKAALLCLLPTFGFAREEIKIPETKGNLLFLENRGQVKDQYGKFRKDVQYAVHGSGLNIFIGDGAIHYQYASLRPRELSGQPGSLSYKPQSNAVADMYRMDVQLVGANKHAIAISEDIQKFEEHYYEAGGSNGQLVTNKHYDVHSYRRVTYKNIYPYIDWVLTSRGTALEYEFVVHPGGNPADIKLQYGGTTALNVDEQGGLEARTPMGAIHEKSPVSFQADGKPVSSSFTLKDHQVSFKMGSYDRRQTLIIDPTLTWGTYYGDTDFDIYYGVATDNAGGIYAAGYTLSLSNIATTGAYQTSNNGQNEGMVTKFSNTGSLLWSTYYGTPSNEDLGAITVNGTNVFVAGSTDYFGDPDALLASFTTAGALNAGLAYGSTGNDYAVAITTNAFGEVYACGTTTSTTNFATVGAFQTTSGGGAQEGWVGKFAGTLSTSSTIWVTFYGGSGWDAATSIATNSAGEVYVAGTTASATGMSTNTTFLNGTYDGFIAKFSSAGSRLWGTYVGGNNIDEIRGIAVDGSGNPCVAGHSSSTTGLATTGAFQSTNQGGSTNLYDGFVARYNASGAKQWATYNGGSDDDYLMSIAIAGSDLVVAGYTSSTASIASITGAFQSIYGGSTDGMISRFTSAGSRLWGTYYGGNGTDNISAVAITSANEIVISGGTQSTNNIATPGALQGSFAGNADGWVAKITDCTLPATPTSLSGPTAVCVGTTQTYSVPAITGATSYTWVLPSGWTGTSATNSITVTAGAAGGTIAVNANNACGAGTALNTTITVNTPPTATINAAGPTTFCSGGNVVLNGSPVGTGFSYQWILNNVNIPGATNPTLTATTSGSYTLAVSIGGSCSNTSTATIVTVNVGPATPSASSNSPVCPGQNLTLTASSSTSGVTYLWSGPNSFLSTSQNPTITGVTSAAAGTYTVTASANGCSSTATTIVVISSGAPAAPTNLTGNTSLCANGTQTYSVPPVAGATSYTWNLPTGWSGSSTTNTITVTAGSTGGTLSVTAGNNCGTSPALTATLTIVPPPIATISAGGPTTFCAGDSVLLSANTGAGYTYQWKLNNVNIPGATNPTYWASVAGNYQVTVSNGANCSTTSAALTISQSPTPAGLTATSNSPICVGQTLNLNANTTTAGVNYIWTGPNSFLSTSQNPTIANTTPAAAGTYTVTAELNGCTSTATTTVVVSNNAPATPGNISGNATLCTAGSQTYTVPQDPNVSSYTWTLPAGWSGTSTTSSINVTAGTAGGTISVTASNNCGNSTPQTLNVSVQQPPTVTISQTGAVLATTAGFSSYQWYLNGNTISGATNQNYTTTQSGSYYVVVNDGVCTGQSNTINVTSAISEMAKQETISLYPNPNQGSFTIQGTLLQNGGIVGISICDMTGRIVYNADVTIQGRQLLHYVAMSQISGGVYVIKVSSTAGLNVLSFVKD